MQLDALLILILLVKGQVQHILQLLMRLIVQIILMLCLPYFSHKQMQKIVTRQALLFAAFSYNSSNSLADANETNAVAIGDLA